MYPIRAIKNSAASLFSFALITASLALACKSGKAPGSESAAPKASASAAIKAAPSASARAERPKPQKPDPIPAPPDVAAPPQGAEKTASGLASIVLAKGMGTEHPTDESQVKVHYTGWTKDGEMFDSSVQRNRPSEFKVTGVIKGWTEGLKLMVVGEKRRFWIPAKLAYGEEARGGRPAGQLTFDVELIEIIKPPEPPEVPKDVKAAPANAKKTKSGLAYRVLQKGTGTKHPTDANVVQVHYSGWTTDGKMFDSSVLRNRPATFPLKGVIKGWTEGVQLMVEGEKTRFWIPGNLAYGDTPKRPGAPAGTLVFDIELIKIMGK